MGNRLPLSTAIRAGEWVLLSGIPPVRDGAVTAPEDPSRQAELVLDRMTEALGQFNMNLSHLAYVQIFLRDMADLDAINAVYARRMPRPYPARKVICSAFSLPDVRVEMNGYACSLPQQSIIID